MLTRFGLAVALTLAAAVPAAAQHHPEHGAGAAQQPGMHLNPFQPDQLLSKRAELELTADQVTRLERIAAEAKAKGDQAKATHDQHKKQMMEALMADNPSTDAVAGHFQAAHGAMGAAHWAELEAGLAAMSALTDKQRATVKSWSHGMGHGMGQGTGQGMACCQKKD